MPDPVERQALPDRWERAEFEALNDYAELEKALDTEMARGRVEREIERRADERLADAKSEANGAFKLLAAAEAERDRLRAENERLRKFAESAAAAFHDLDYESGYHHARAALARASDEGPCVGCEGGPATYGEGYCATCWHGAEYERLMRWVHDTGNHVLAAFEDCKACEALRAYLALPADEEKAT